MQRHDAPEACAVQPACSISTRGWAGAEDPLRRILQEGSCNCLVQLCPGPAAAPCERFMAGPEHPPCKSNFFRFCHTDLAANAMSRAKLMAQERRFGLADPGGTTGDGYMAQELKAAGWKVRMHA